MKATKKSQRHTNHPISRLVGRRALTPLVTNRTRKRNDVGDAMTLDPVDGSCKKRRNSSTVSGNDGSAVPLVAVLTMKTTSRGYPISITL
jgi:hypothetical protein